LKFVIPTKQTQARFRHKVAAEKSTNLLPKKTIKSYENNLLRKLEHAFKCIAVNQESL
jgi:hypothetical protein